jgi:hypothetical protein
MLSDRFNRVGFVVFAYLVGYAAAAMELPLWLVWVPPVVGAAVIAFAKD